MKNRYLLNNTVPLQDSTQLRVRQGLGHGRDITNDIDKNELLYLLASTRIRRDRNASWPGTMSAEWVIEIRQDGNRFHRTILIALGENHVMMTERGFGHLLFRISNGDEIVEVLERRMAEQTELC